MQLHAYEAQPLAMNTTIHVMASGCEAVGEYCSSPLDMQWTTAVSSDCHAADGCTVRHLFTISRYEVT